MSRAIQISTVIFVNLLPLAGVYFMDWLAWQLILIYLAEYVFSGFILIMKILLSSPYKKGIAPSTRMTAGIVFTVAALWFHFLFVMALGSLVLHVAPGIEPFRSPSAEQLTLSYILVEYLDEGLVYVVIAILASQLLTFFNDFIKTGKSRLGNSGFYFLLIVIRPFGLFIFIAAGAIAAMMIGLLLKLQSLALLFLVIMIIAKIIMEIMFTVWELERTSTQKLQAGK